MYNYRQRALIFRTSYIDVPNARFFGGRVPTEGYDSQIRTPRFFYNVRIPPKFHHSVLTRSEVIVLTNPETSPAHTDKDSGENIQRSSLRYDLEQ